MRRNSFQYLIQMEYIVTNLINALPGSSSVNSVHYATIEEAVFSVSSAQKTEGTGFSVTSC
jgi:hypothetical protein